jgi:hypothetical protein
MGDDLLLANCLAELEDDGWDLHRVLAGHPELPESVRSALEAAAYLRRAPRPLPSPAFRAGSRQRLLELIQANGLVDRSTSRFDLLVRRFSPRVRPLAVPIAASLVLVLAFAGAINASASALPATPLYPAKLAIERVQVLTALTPQEQARTHLALASRRLQEAQAEEAAGNQVVVAGLLASYDREIATAREDEAAATSSPSTPATPTALVAVSTQIATLQADREQVVDRAGLPVASRPNAPALSRPTVAATSAAPTAAPPTQAAVVARAVPLTEHPEPVAAVDDRGSNNASNAHPRGLGPGKSDNPSTQPAQVEQRPAPPTVTAAPTDSVEAVFGQMLSRAMVGDADGASAAAQQYAQALQAMPRGGGFAFGRLAGQRAQLVLAIERAPTSTRPSLQRALAAIDATLGAASSAPVQSVAPARDEAGGRDAAPTSHGGGSGGGNPHSDTSSASSDQSDPGPRGTGSDGHRDGDFSAQGQSSGDRHGQH